MNKYVLLLIVLTVAIASFAQDDLLEELESETEEVVFTQPAFKAMRICNIQSTKNAQKGDFYMYISHRFGSIKGSVRTFFGLDNANTKIQFVYGITDWMQIGLSRESFRKTYAGHVKFKFMNQSKKMPLNMGLYSTINVNTELEKSQYPHMVTADRFSYATQLLISRSFWNRLSLLIAPTYIRQNLDFSPGFDHHQFALGMGFRVKVSKRISINMDYSYNFVRHKESIYKNPLSVGIDIETGGHVFQLLFSNAQSTNEPGFMANAGGDWLKGDIYFGFNIVRVFGTKGKKQKRKS